MATVGVEGLNRLVMLITSGRAYCKRAWNYLLLLTVTITFQVFLLTFKNL